MCAGPRAAVESWFSPTTWTPGDWIQVLTAVTFTHWTVCLVYLYLLNASNVSTSPGHTFSLNLKPSSFANFSTWPCKGTTCQTRQEDFLIIPELLSECLSNNFENVLQFVCFSPLWWVGFLLLEKYSHSGWRTSSAVELWLLFQKTCVQFAASVWQLTVIRNSSSRISSGIRHPWCTQTCMQVEHPYTWMDGWTDGWFYGAPTHKLSFI